MEEQKKPQTKDYYYKVDPSYRLMPANSVLTTITPDGCIKIDFLVESLAIPDRLTFDVSNPNLSAPLDAEPKDKTQRHVQGGILVSPEQAEFIANAIKQQVDILKNAKKTSK